MKFTKLLAAMAFTATMASPAVSQAASGMITPGLSEVEVIHNGKRTTITRLRDKNATIPEAYNHAGLACPPFCIQPMTVVAGVETVGEIEVLGYLQRKANGDSKVLVIDSRTSDWIARGTIPGSVNIPWNKINLDVVGAFAVESEAETMDRIMTESFGARLVDDGWDFSTAKTLVFFCNGSWCPQSSTNIRTLAKMGYPKRKLKWYRGGMQDWVSLGLSTVNK